MQIAANGIALEVEVEDHGSPAGEPLLLIMGLGMQLVAWHEDFVALLVARGFRVIRFDNRDIGLSQGFDAAGVPNLGIVSIRFALGLHVKSPYTLTDMAADSVGLLDALSLDSAHIVGASMGGMIAQTIAIEHPNRIRSLTSIMSTTGNSAVGQASQQAIGALLSPPALDRQEAVDRTVSIFRIIGSPGFDLDEAELREQAGLSYDRADDPLGVARQLLAIIASGDRTERLRSISVPTLVIHGAGDPLVDVSGGRATAAAVPGAELDVIEGMGHDLPRALWPEITERIAALVQRAQARTA